MAVVYRAFDTVLNRDVAVKYMQTHRSHDPTLLERFHREARAAAKIDHPNVVTIYDVAESEDGRPYIVMEFVDGTPLSKLIAAEPLDSEHVACIGAGIARGLAAAHELGLVHRDVKPANVIIDLAGKPHLSDFGLAQAADEHVAELTSPGLFLGSANYVAPEQARSGEATPKSDLYALGAVMYQMCTGSPPFVGGPIDVAIRHIEEDALPLHAEAPRIDEELAGTIDMLLRRDPTRRPTDAGVVAENLAAIADRLAPAPAPPPPLRG